MITYEPHQSSSLLSPITNTQEPVYLLRKIYLLLRLVRQELNINRLHLD